MSKPRVLVLRAPGINCDEETSFAWERAGAMPQRLHIGRLIEAPHALDDYQILTIPGGFSYGDDIASGKVLANQLIHHVGDALRRFIDRGGRVLGICNGFQVLVRMNLVPGPDCPVRVTLTHNDTGRYEDRWVRCRAEQTHCTFVDPDAEFDFPVAHGQGKVLVEGGEDGVAALRRLGRIVLVYASRSGSMPVYPDNPNGSIGNAAGLTDGTGRVLGLMPHPERNLFTSQNPDPNRDFRAETAGSRFFRRIVERLG